MKVVREGMGMGIGIEGVDQARMSWPPQSREKDNDNSRKAGIFDAAHPDTPIAMQSACG